MLVLIISAILLIYSAARLAGMVRPTRAFDYANPAKEWRGEIPRSATNHTQVTGVLAGFSITIVVLAVTLGLESSSWVLTEAVVRMFVVAFFGFVSAALVFSIVTQRKLIHRYYLFSNASSLYFLSVVVSLTAILLLLEAVGGEYNTFGAGMAMAAGGYWAACIPAVDLLLYRRRLCLLLGLATASLTGVYLGVGHFFDGLTDYKLVLRLNLISSAIAIGFVFMGSVISFSVWERRPRLAKYLSLGFLAMCSSCVWFVVLTTLLYVAPIAKEEQEKLRRSTDSTTPRKRASCVVHRCIGGDVGVTTDDNPAIEGELP